MLMEAHSFSGDLEVMTSEALGSKKPVERFKEKRIIDRNNELNMRQVT